MTINSFVPYLSIKNAHEAVDFYSRVFDTSPTSMVKTPDGGVMHCAFQIGEARLFLSEELPENGGNPSPGSLGATTVAIHLYVDDCDAMIARMKENGAEVLMEPEDMFWGERYGRVRDPFGHDWGIAKHLRDMTDAEVQSAAEEFFKEMPG